MGTTFPRVPLGVTSGKYVKMSTYSQFDQQRKQIQERFRTLGVYYITSNGTTSMVMQASVC